MVPVLIPPIVVPNGKSNTPSTNFTRAPSITNSFVKTWLNCEVAFPKDNVSVKYGIMSTVAIPLK
jgi:hypothetical protein